MYKDQSIYRCVRTVLAATVFASVFISSPGSFSAAWAEAVSETDQSHVTDETEIALSLAKLLMAARAVISDNQALINDHTRGDKGMTGEVVLSEALRSYQLQTGVDLRSIDSSSLQGQLITAEMEAIVEVMAEYQERINRVGIGFKGLLPAIFAAKVGQMFSEKKGNLAEIRLTAPRDYVRNRANFPDLWEDQVIESRLKSAEHPLGQPFAAVAAKDGREAFRLALPEYYKHSCLSCHGKPKGGYDITGGRKEGAEPGELGGVISVVIFQ